MVIDASFTPSSPAMGATCRFSNGNGLPVTISYAVRSAASITPPVTAKMSAAPVDKPSGRSILSSGRAAKLMPACLIMRASSRVVSTMSTSWNPLSAISGRAHSNFFAVQGMTETTTMSLGFMPRARPMSCVRKKEGMFSFCFILRANTTWPISNCSKQVGQITDKA